MAATNLLFHSQALTGIILVSGQVQLRTVFSASRVIPTYLGLKDKTARGIGGGGREPDEHDEPTAPGHINIINSSCMTFDERYRNTLQLFII